MTLATVSSFLKRRISKICPIYLVCTLLALAVAVRPYPWPTVLENLLLLQVARVPLIHENDPAWSLNYEVLHYLAFIPRRYRG